MSHYLDYMDTLYTDTLTNIKKRNPDWKIDNNFVIYKKITPVEKNINFQTTFKLRKEKKTSVILEQVFNKRKSKQYFSEYQIIDTLIYLYDSFEVEGDAIYNGMRKLINDEGVNVNFKIDNNFFNFNGIEYLYNDKSFLTFADYQIGINDFIGLLNLVIEKDRYSYESENGKDTILKYILFLLLFSKRINDEQKENMKTILIEKHLYLGSTLIKYKDIINRTGESKLYFKYHLFKNSL